MTVFSIKRIVCSHMFLPLSEECLVWIPTKVTAIYNIYEMASCWFYLAFWGSLFITQLGTRQFIQRQKQNLWNIDCVNHSVFGTVIHVCTRVTPINNTALPKSYVNNQIIPIAFFSCHCVGEFSVLQNNYDLQQ